MREVTEYPGRSTGGTAVGGGGRSGSCMEEVLPCPLLWDLVRHSYCGYAQRTIDTSSPEELLAYISLKHSQWRMFTARPATNATVRSDVRAWQRKSILTQRVSGMVSVGL